MVTIKTLWMTLAYFSMCHHVMLLLRGVTLGINCLMLYCISVNITIIPRPKEEEEEEEEEKGPVHTFVHAHICNTHT